MTDEERKIVVKWLKSKKGITDINWWLKLAKEKDEEAWLVEQAKKNSNLHVSAIFEYIAYD